MAHRVITFSLLLLRTPISVHTRKEGVVISVSSLLLLLMSVSMIPVRQKDWLIRTVASKKTGD